MPVGMAFGQADAIKLKQDFRNSQFSEQDFRYSGKNAKSYVTPTKDGLRIYLPGKGGRDDAGVATKFPVEGDFVYTVSYRIVKVSPPKKGYGVGVQIYAPMNQAPGKPAIVVSRSLRLKGGDSYTTGYMHTDENQKRIPDVKSFPINSPKSGKLRMERTGNVFTISAASKGDNDFRQLHQWDAGNHRISFLQVAAKLGGDDSPLELLIEDITLNTKGALPPTEPTSSVETPTQQPGKNNWIWLAAGGGVLVISVTVCLWIWSRNREEEEEYDEDEDEDEE